jgi:hypothetical protein
MNLSSHIERLTPHTSHYEKSIYDSVRSSNTGSFGKLSVSGVNQQRIIGV